MSEFVKMFDYWSFHGDGSVQFFQICEGSIYDYCEYSNVRDAPIVLIKPTPDAPEILYHGHSYLAPMWN